MRLLTKAIIKKAQRQYPRANDMEQIIVAKFFNPMGSWKWYMMNLGDDENYAWGIVKGDYVEMGSWLMSELSNLDVGLGLGIERDLHFTPITANECWDKLNNGEFV